MLVVPEARGQNGFGSDISERDLLDVMADVQANYPIDRNQVFSGGYSQGGYITYRMAELYPDRFAGAVDWVGFTGDDENGTPAQGQGYTAGAVGNVIDFVGNLRRVPTFMLYSGADELVHVNTALAMQSAFEATDNVFVFYLHPAAEHLTYAALDDPITNPGPYLVVGRVTVDHGDVLLKVTQMTPFYQRPAPYRKSPNEPGLSDP